MPKQAEKGEKHLRRLRGRESRSQSFGTKLTPDEHRQVLAAAEAEGKASSEWARDLLLRGADAGSRGEKELHLFTELVGIQMLLMSALDPVLRGEKMTREQLAVLYRRVQTTKAAQARDLLAKRNLKEEK